MDRTARPSSTSAAGRRGGAAQGLATMLASGTSNQVGAALGSHAFPVIGPLGVVAVRQVLAAAVLLPTVRPPLRTLTRAQWWPVIALGLVFATMNLTLYTAIDRIGLALAVTLEFLGPLAVALLGSRRPSDLVCAAAAGVGVYVLVAPGPSTDVVGVALALAAAVCWALYIVLNRLVGRRLPGLQGTAAASGVSALFYLPVVVAMLATGRLAHPAVGWALAAGVLSSIVPFALDLTALRTVPARLFGLFMSVHPVLAAAVGLVLLRQSLAPHEIVGIAIVVVTNVVGMAPSRTATAARSIRRPTRSRQRFVRRPIHPVPGRE